MFHNRRAHADIKKTTQKFLDHKKESQARLRALRTLLDVFDASDSRIFFKSHYSEIFYIFHDVFSIVETNLKTRGHRSQREDLDSVLFILEKILLYLPDLLHKRWQFNSIGRIMRKLLHHGNALKLRREGVRLFMLWFQALQENSDEFCQLIFACLVPGFPNPVNNVEWTGRSELTREAAEAIFLSMSEGAYREQLSSNSSWFSSSGEKESEDWCIQDDVGPIFPWNTAERNPPQDALTKFFLDRVLDCMSTQLVGIGWMDKENRERAFFFLFENFRKFYLLHIFQDFNPSKTLYDSSPAALAPRAKPNVKDMESDQRMISARESVLRWFVAFTVRFKRTYVVPMSPNVNQSVVSISSTDSSEPGSPGASDAVGVSPERNKETLLDASEVIRKVLYSTRSNVRLLHEVFRQGFLLPAKNASTIRQVLMAYHEWIKSDDKPAFMLEPQQDVLKPLDVTDADNYSPQSPIRSLSYSYAVDRKREKVFKLPCEDVRAGLQANLRAFILNSATVFLVEEDTKFVEKQVDLCKRVIHLYRSVVLEVPMDPVTWEQLLEALLEASRHLLVPEMADNKALSVAKEIAGSLLQTLFVTWIRANLTVKVPITLWNKCLEVISSATHWSEIITEWKVTIETLTRVMARTVYGLDMGDLPLERLTEQKQKRKRRPQVTQERAAFTKASFTRWSRMEKANAPKQLTLYSNGDKAGSPVISSRPQISLILPSNDPGRPASNKMHEHSNSAIFPTSTPVEDNVSALRKSASSPTVTAGSATVKGSDVAGQLTELENVSQENRELSQTGSMSTKSEESRVPFTLASDTESVESLDIQSKYDQDAVADGDQDSAKPADVTDGSLLPPRPNRLSSTDSYLSREDSTKSLLWYGSSLDFEVGPYAKCSSLETQQPQLEKINESNLEAKLGELQQGQGRHKTIHRTSTPAHEVRLALDGGEGNAAPLKPVIVEFEHDGGGRSSPESSGRETPEDLASGSRSSSPSPSRSDEEVREELLDPDFGEEDAHVEEETSVIAGGSREGWSPVVAVVLWRRMLGILGNVNKIKEPLIHAEVFECLTSVWNMLAKVRLNQGISLDNKSTPAIPVLIPPLQHMATWVFEAAVLSMNNEFKSGRLLAYKLMCAMTVCRQDVPLTQEYLTHFYRLMHIGLTGTDQDVTSTIVRSCTHFFSVMLPSSSLLILDFIQAANGVVISQNMELPREEAMTLLGSLLCFPNVYPNMPLHQPGHQTNEYQHKSTGKDIKDKLIATLLRASKLEPSCSARCIALNSIGVFIVEELIHCQGHPKIHDCICVLLASVTFHNRSVCHVACEVIHLLSEYYTELCGFDEDLPLKIVEVLCHAVVNLLPGGEAVHIQEQHKVLVTVLMCLLDWLMVIPVSKLMSKTNEDENISLLNRVFKVLNMAASNKGPKKKAKQLNISTIISGDGRPIRLGKLQGDDRGSGVFPSSPVEQQPDSGAEDSQDMDGQDTFDFPPKTDSVELTARAVMMHLVNHMGQYPLGAGPSRVDSLISEHEDNPNVDAEELLPSVFNSPNLQFFVLNDRVLISLVELPLEESPDFYDVPASTAATQVRLIMRDMTGKNVWDYTLLHGSLTSDIEHHRHNGSGIDVVDNVSPRDGRSSPLDALMKARKSSTPVPGDRLDELLCDIGSSSHECLLYTDHSLNEPGPSPEGVLSDIECDIIDTVLEQDIGEKNQVENDADDPRLSSLASIPPPYEAPMSPFQLCRFVVSQTGMLASEKRMKIDLLKKNDRFLRELKNLDNRRCRETHKIALLYVAQGEEDKASIMFNSAGSEEYERFVAGLAWEVDLSKHTGFLGGLERNLSTGTTAPYYCNSTTEVIFHVSTRMPLDSDSNGFNTKVRHLGNDEVHIVWSEHYRDYRHGIVNTEFGDVMIVIYPLTNHLFRIQIIKKPKVPMFGPLFDGALVDRKVLPSLVRATAINASRASRELLPVYERYYEERENCIDRIVKNHKEPTTYEDFASLVFCPAPRPAGSEPPTPVLSHIVRTHTGAGSSFSANEKSSVRNRSKSAVAAPRLAIGRLVQEEDLAVTSSLPDGLDNMEAGVSSVTDGGNPRQDKRRLSIRWRNKLASHSSTLNADSD